MSTKTVPIAAPTSVSGNTAKIETITGPETKCGRFTAPSSADEPAADAITISPANLDMSNTAPTDPEFGTTVQGDCVCTLNFTALIGNIG